MVFFTYNDSVFRGFAIFYVLMHPIRGPGSSVGKSWMVG